ncbi:sensor domain-containing protein [Dickeya zeae]|uniref:Diguanylate cyclase n=1 Tax=Dickeya zeae TaxID=204042 RepID=A0ABX8W294_9GAMM|nr:diguanylate cyclase [Dickeya zeae]QYM94167.1 diguanylate cyclase [Dickeya zeae]
MAQNSRINKAELYEHILRSMYDGVHVIDMNGIVLVENKASEKMLGWTSCNLVGLHGHEKIHHHHANNSVFPNEDCPIYQTIIDGIPRHVTDDVFWRQDGTFFPVEYATSPLSDQSGVIYGVTVVFRDISERKRAEKMRNAVFQISQAAHDADDLSDLLTTLHQIISDLLPAKNFYVALYEKENDILTFPYFIDETMTTPAAQPLAQAPLIARVISSVSVLSISPSDRSDCIDENQENISTKAAHWLGIPLVSDQRGIGALVLQSYQSDIAFSEHDKELLQYVSTQIASAIELQRYRDQLSHMALYDALTNLPNRLLFDERYKQCLEHAQRYKESFALINIDLDKFKSINDRFGHAVGDELLRIAATRMRGCVRASDTIGRVGGDEFLGLILHIHDELNVQRIADSICNALLLPFEIQGQALFIGASIGIAIYPDHGTDAASLKHAADQAMYVAKRDGGGSFSVCTLD